MWTEFDLLYKSNSVLQNSKLGIVIDLLIEKCRDLLLCLEIRITSSEEVGSQNLQKGIHSFILCAK